MLRSDGAAASLQKMQRGLSRRKARTRAPSISTVPSAGARNLLSVGVSPNLVIAVYTLLGIAVVLLIFLGALAFVDAARKGNRQLKWAARPASPPRERP